ncbi:MAG: galactose mutarotase [Burkholderiales bacterium]|nr:galactose mutarotase [Burkholderiales bacterium]
MTFEPLDPTRFRTSIDGANTDLFTLSNQAGMQVRFTNQGAKILQLIVPDRNGNLDDVVLGYDSIEDVLTGQPSMGAFVGRYAGRIAHGRFALDGRDYALGTNNNGHTLHGGVKGSRHRVFDVVSIDASRAEMELVYADGEEGFPGRLASRVVYEVTEDNALDITWSATSDAPTVVNFTSHAFFNLAGHAAADETTSHDHLLTIFAGRYAANDAQLIPNGLLRQVAGTPLDFRVPRRIGDAADAPDPLVAGSGGYDHTAALNKPYGAYGIAARLAYPPNGRVMEVWSDEPALVFYGGGGLTGEIPRDRGKGGKVYGRRAGLCLEPEHFGNSPNLPSFPSTVLRPGQVRRGRITYRFSTAS